MVGRRKKLSQFFGNLFFAQQIFWSEFVLAKKDLGHFFWAKIIVDQKRKKTTFGSKFFLAKKDLGQHFFWPNKNWVSNSFGHKKLGWKYF